MAGIPDVTRPLFDRLDRLLREVAPGVEVSLAYGMPTYRVGARGLHVGAWSHGLSVYGWEAGRDDGFAARHPRLDSGKGTLRLTRAAAAVIDDEELRGLLRAVLAP